MANTTIQISEETKNKLFEVINNLEKKWGRRITYDEAIAYLIQQKHGIVSKEEFINNLKQFKGILKPGEGQSLLKEMRREELEREERFTK